MLKVKLVLLGLLLVAILVFSLQNLDAMDLRFLLWKVSISRALVLMMVFVFGVLGGWLLGAIVKIREK